MCDEVGGRRLQWWGGWWLVNVLKASSIMLLTIYRVSIRSMIIHIVVVTYGV